MILKKLPNPKGSYIYRANAEKRYSTPSGSYLSFQYSGYKYINPSDCDLLNLPITNGIKEAVK